MRHGGWRNESCAKGYIEDSLHYKERTGNMITSSIFAQTSSTVNCADLPNINGEISSSVNGASSSTIIDQTAAVVDDLFESEIDEKELIQLVDSVSQNNVEELSQHGVITEDQIGTNGRISSNIGGERSKGGATGTVFSQCINNNSLVNALIPDSSKSINFGKIERCTFNFYMNK